jgi:hypothetical protein
MSQHCNSYHICDWWDGLQIWPLGEKMGFKIKVSHCFWKCEITKLQQLTLYKQYRWDKSSCYMLFKNHCSEFIYFFYHYTVTHFVKYTVKLAINHLQIWAWQIIPKRSQIDNISSQNNTERIFSFLSSNNKIKWQKLEQFPPIFQSCTCITYPWIIGLMGKKQETCLHELNYKVDKAASSLLGLGS